jgi:hypothetical protein
MLAPPLPPSANAGLPSVTQTARVASAVVASSLALVAEVACAVGQDDFSDAERTERDISNFLSALMPDDEVTTEI